MGLKQGQQKIQKKDFPEELRSFEQPNISVELPEKLFLIHKVDATLQIMKKATLKWEPKIWMQWKVPKVAGAEK